MNLRLSAAFLISSSARRARDSGGARAVRSLQEKALYASRVGVLEGLPAQQIPAVRIGDGDRIDALGHRRCETDL